jgi:hypothetical protein
VEFQRRHRFSRWFDCVSGEGGFSVRRPFVLAGNRNGLRFARDTSEYEVRTEDRAIWVLDGERLVGYANGMEGRWELTADDESLLLWQPKIGTRFSTVASGSNVLAEVRGRGFPLKDVSLEGASRFGTEQRAFLMMMVLLSWQETGQQVNGGGASGGGGG